jgi:ribosomal protein S18 acetylase RimI-like enzyme
VPTTRSDDRLESIEIGGRVHEFEFRPSRSARFDGDERIGDRCISGALDDSTESFGTLGMTRAGEMVEIRRMGGEEHGHRYRRYRRDSMRPATATVRPSTSAPGEATLIVPTGVLDRIDGPAADARIAEWLDNARRRGCTLLRTNAVDIDTGRHLERCGFVVDQRLVLLSRSLSPDRPTSLPTGAARLRPVRAMSRHLTTLVDIDRRAFGDEQSFDGGDLLDCLRATPRSRCIAAWRDRHIVGFIIVGRAAREGFLQRLAVRPEHRRSGIARSLVTAGCDWLADHGAVDVVVNTADDNDAALGLYGQLGFTRRTAGLVVLRQDLDGTRT